MGLEEFTICCPAPFSTDQIAIIERNQCDYSQKITLDMARTGQATRRIRIYANGNYDLFHQGHARQLMEAKNIFPNVYLIVGVYNDEMAIAMKSLTVMTEQERYQCVCHSRYVDEVVKDAPQIIDSSFLKEHKIDFVAHDNIPYTINGKDIYASLKAKGMFIAIKDTEELSTADIVARVVKDYDVYVRRNYARGYSAKELNISYLSEMNLRFEKKVHEWKLSSLQAIGKLKYYMIISWRQKSREIFNMLLELCGLRHIKYLADEIKYRIIQAFSPPKSTFQELHQ